MKLLLTILAITFLFSCKKDYSNIELTQAKPIGDTTRNPDLAVIDNDVNIWKNRLNYGVVGSNLGNEMYVIPSYIVTSGDTGMFHLPIGTNIKVIRYACPIGNVAAFDTTGKHDLVYNRKLEGVTNPYYGGQDIKGILEVSVFQNGLPTITVNKQNFAITPTDSKIGFDWSKTRTYGADTSYLFAGTADLYHNMIPFEKDGKYVAVIRVNPDTLIRESDYSNNITLLPINVSGNSVVIDYSAIAENKVHPATNFTAKWTGKTKSIFINWDCPYHAPYYVKHYFTLKRDGVVIADNFDESEFTDKVFNPKHVYEVTITVVGLGSSVGTAVKN